ncbi:hypothetical protein HPB50_027875 [Hyalomma asiaticum]|nr:hypothetical protein HPB50_027875 [Hyalomma asiaticum]
MSWIPSSKIQFPPRFLGNKQDCPTVKGGVEELEHTAEGKHRLADMSPTGQRDAIGFLVLSPRCPHLFPPLLPLILEQVRCGCHPQQTTPIQDREHRAVTPAHDGSLTHRKKSRGHHGNVSGQPRNFFGTSPWPLPASSHRSRKMESGKECLLLDIEANIKTSRMSLFHASGVLEQLQFTADTICLLEPMRHGCGA